MHLCDGVLQYLLIYTIHIYSYYYTHYNQIHSNTKQLLRWLSFKNEKSSKLFRTNKPIIKTFKSDKRFLVISTNQIGNGSIFVPCLKSVNSIAFQSDLKSKKYDHFFNIILHSNEFYIHRKNIYFDVDSGELFVGLKSIIIIIIEIYVKYLWSWCNSFLYNFEQLPDKMKCQASKQKT